MRMEVGREASAAAAAAEGSVAPDAAQKAAQRMRELKEERQRWITKRQQSIARQEKLLKLLELQRAKKSKAGDAANSESEPPAADGQTGEDKATKTAAATTSLALTRKKELKELQARAQAAQEKQQQAANVLARNLKQLLARNAQRAQASKRKREEEATENPPSKKVDVGANAAEIADAAPEMHPFAAGSDIDVATPELAGAACFRIALRHLAQTGMVMSLEKLEQEFNKYTGKKLSEVIDSSLLEQSLSCLNAVGSKQSRDPSSSNTQQGAGCWQPGRQFLKISTFSSSDADHIQTLIDVEKQIVVDACDSLWMEQKVVGSAAAIYKRRQKQFLTSLLGDCLLSPNSFTLSTILSACVGVNPKGPSSSYKRRFPYQLHGQMSSVFDKMEVWLNDQAKKSAPNNILSPRLDEVTRHRGSRGHFYSAKYAKPFSVASDSVVKQLREAGSLHSAVARKFDPMKILCHYELNGVCNDKNCSYYHQKDYEPVARKIENSISNCADEEDGSVGMDEMDQLLLAFAEFRRRIMTKWPVICTSLNSAMTDKGIGANGIESPLSAPEPDLGVGQKGQQRDDDDGENTDDFLLLDLSEELPALGDARYFDDMESRNLYGVSLHTRVEEDPKDTDAWLLLAIYHLELDVGSSDESANLSDDARLQQQLVFLSKELNAVHRHGAPRKLNIEEANVKRCLHTLSRALEVEANAYCEALWLLYLHLCGQVANKQTEIDMVEQAVQFLPSSHALWLHYISTYDFDSVGMAEGIYWRLLEHLARVNQGEDGPASNRSPKKELSILLTAICFHLCIKLWHAGATRRVLELLSALLQIDDSTSEFEWCKIVRGQIRGDEIIVMCFVFAHVLLFNELPKVVEHWVAANSYESVPIKRMAYTIESLASLYFQVDDQIFDRVLGAYELAFRTYQNQCRGVQEAGDVLLSNWMLLFDFQEEDKRDESLRTFFNDKLSMIRQFPAASLTAAKIMASKSSSEQQAHRLMLTMMNQCSQAQFPEALHHYLFACRQSSGLVNALDKAFPNVMQRLAGLLEVDIDNVEKFIQDIMHDTSNISKARALKALLDALLTAWMDQFARLCRQTTQDVHSDQKLQADVFVALDICLLMGILLEPPAAIDGLQLVLSSSYFSCLSLEARQLSWMQRFVFEVDLLQQDDVDTLQWREHQTNLTKLFRKYVIEMSVEAEMVRQSSKRIKDGVERNAVEDAVCDCLYPERHCLMTFDANLELFRLCLAAVTGPEKTKFYASFTDSLALSSEFSLAFSDAASHEWELLAARAGLRKCLGRVKTQHPQVLQALVAVELRLRNMKAVSSLLESEMQAEPLLLETWRLVVGLEILFGEQSDARSQKISAEMEKRQLIFACNTFGDDILSSEGALCQVGDSNTTLTLRGLRLGFVPSAVLLKNKLVSLDISANELTELPIGMSRLKNLQKLDASENGLVEFPACVGRLTQLQELRLSHNNIDAVPTYALSNLKTMDIRRNAVTHLSAPTLAALQNLKVLHTKGNAIPEDDLAKISDLLSSRKDAALEAQTSGSKATAQTGEKQSEALLDNPLVEGRSLSSADANIEVAAAPDKLIAAEEIATAFDAKQVDGDQIMGQDDTNPGKEVTADHMVADIDQASPAIVVQAKTTAEEFVTEPVSKELDGDQIMETVNSVIEIEDSTSATVDDATRSPDEVIEVDSAGSTEETEHNNNVTDLMSEAANDALEPATSVEMPGSCASESVERGHFDVNPLRRQSSNEVANIARRKLAAYMEQAHIDNRAEVRKRNPALWREFVAANLPVKSEWPVCKWCLAPNDGHNQRFNSTVICVQCLEEAVCILKES